ncbi:hypothetical protein ACRRTK_003967 [Alexandromys fortis]
MKAAVDLKPTLTIIKTEKVDLELFPSPELTLYKSWACVLSQCDDSQNRAVAFPGPVETSQALRATGRRRQRP